MSHRKREKERRKRGEEKRKKREFFIKAKLFSDTDKDITTYVYQTLFYNDYYFNDYNYFTFELYNIFYRSSYFPI